MILLVLTAALIIWSQVKVRDVGSTPARCTTDLRYQSNCVFAEYGTPTSLPFQVAVWIGDRRMPFSNSVRSASVNVYSQPALASSGLYGGSMFMKSIDGSPAASRRTRCSRWPSAGAGSRG